MHKSSKNWLLFTGITTLFFGVWGAFIEIPEKNGFPATLGYSVWALTMILPALISLNRIKWKISFTAPSIFYGCLIGITGAGGQLILFTNALTLGPAYMIFPIISLSPVITILLSYLFLRERANKVVWAGIILAMLSIPLLSYVSPESGVSGGALWLVFALIVFAAWGIQAFFIKIANQTMKAEEIFFYMTITGLLFIPLALYMTDFSNPINYGLDGMYLAAGIQLLNAVGALTLVYAFRYGKAIVVSPLTNSAAPLLTVMISLIIYGFIPNRVVIAGMILATCATFLISFGEEFGSSTDSSTESDSLTNRTDLDQ